MPYRYVLVREPITKHEKAEREKLREVCERRGGFNEEDGVVEAAQRCTDYALQETLYYLGNHRDSQLTFDSVDFIAGIWARALSRWC